MKEFNMFLVYIILCTLFWQITITNSRTSTFWKLNPDEGKITGYTEQVKDFLIPSTSTAAPASSSSDNDNNNNNNNNGHNDEIFNIITSTVVSYSSGWSKQSIERLCDSPEDEETKKLNSTPQNGTSNNNNNSNSNNNNNNGIDINQKQMKKVNRETNDVLDCGKPVNFTYYDYLIGVAQRFNHPSVPEPEVAFLFLKNKDEKSLKNFDINALEKRLKRAKREKPRSVHLYNQIGNYWRIKGDTRQSIECFRRALAISPTNAEVLLNLARVLFNLQYLDDAIHLTRRSLEVQSPDRSAWRQYFTLGEIFKAYGHFQESLLHLRHALELYPQHEPILKMLRDVENSPASPLHVYTLLIIFALVIAVFIVIVTSTDSSDKNNSQSEFEPKMQRHFNRAMAMRSLKGFSSRTFKHRKY